MPRLFTALEIPPAIATTLALLQGGLNPARWIDRENYHITLRFIGDIDCHTADEVAETLSKVERRPLKLKICGLDAFGGRRPRSLFARIEPSEALVELQRENERMLQRLGLPLEGRKFVPHITLARFRNASSRDVANYLAFRGGFSTPEFEVGRFVLYSAKASTGGGPYVVEHSYQLAARQN